MPGEEDVELGGSPPSTATLRETPAPAAAVAKAATDLIAPFKILILIWPRLGGRLFVCFTLGVEVEFIVVRSMLEGFMGWERLLREKQRKNCEVKWGNVREVLLLYRQGFWGIKGKTDHLSVSFTYKTSWRVRFESMRDILLALPICHGHHTHFHRSIDMNWIDSNL